MLDTNADLFVLVQGGQFLGDLTLDPVDHVLGLVLGEGGFDGNLNSCLQDRSEFRKKYEANSQEIYVLTR